MASIFIKGVLAGDLFLECLLITSAVILLVKILNRRFK